MKTMTAAILTLALLASAGQAASWEVDKPHSTVQFKVSHLVIANVVGSFGDFTASMDFDGENLASGSVEMTVQVASVDTDNADRDKHLRSADFFDAEKFPTMTFKSKKVVPGEGKSFQLVGDLTIRGITKEVTFDCEFNGTAEFMGTTKAGFTAETTINRQDFDVSWNRNLDAGGVVVGEEVKIMLELEFNKAA